MKFTFIVIFLTAIFNLFYYRFNMIQDIYNITISITWLNTVFQSNLATIEIICLFFTFKFFLNDYHLDVGLTSFLAKFNFFVSCLFTPCSLNLQELTCLTRFTSLLKKSSSQNQIQTSSSSPRRF
ncbi:MAG: hypothetical protein Q8807_02355 ['Waltheria sp.' little leaf phytoplasma]|nr:hypothetical protein ['Waltheria sp.' little leaf phytoplasma]